MNLSPRQLQILQLTADGYRGEDISRELGIGPETVRKHKLFIMRILGADNSCQMVAMALRRGLIQ